MALCWCFLGYFTVVLVKLKLLYFYLGEYVGQTKKKVQQKLDAARGGVLFIDEAYELGKGTFGEEALTTILAAMTDPEYKLVIIIAGYPKDMEKMLARNVRLKSR